jgi:hypothetical protein
MGRWCMTSLIQKALDVAWSLWEDTAILVENTAILVKPLSLLRRGAAEPSGTMAVLLLLLLLLPGLLRTHKGTAS